RERGIDLDAPWGELPDDQRQEVIEGEGSMRRDRYPGLRRWFQWLETKTYKMHVRVMLARYRSYDQCGSCGGKRLSARSLVYEVGGLDLGSWHHLELREARARLQDLEVGSGHGALSRRELVQRLSYLEEVGLGYLSLNRQARTLSGGEAQRVSLTAALGTSLTGALFVLDEPTVGLHPTDTRALIAAMRRLADRGNAVLVVEHDPGVIVACDRVVELGPRAGRDGGEIVFDGTPARAKKKKRLATAKAALPVEIKREVRSAEHYLRIEAATAHNLRGFDVELPLHSVVAVCGPSGSGKSTLVNALLYRTLARGLGLKDVEPPIEGGGTLTGGRAIRDLRLVDQSPLGRTSRGNAATYTGAWTRFRHLFAERPSAEAGGLSAGYFSFNVAGGRCETCAGEGAETVEMQFLADVRLTCPACGGKRFRDEVLDVRLEGYNVAEVLEMSVEQALSVFSDETSITSALEPLRRLGLGYLPLGQPLSTLSGGEAQRVKLARTLAEIKGGTLVILDEPSAGLHATEVERLNDAIDDIVRRGGSVIVVDHDPAVLARADHIIELGPGAGSEGGTLVFEGSPAQLLKRGGTRSAAALGEAVTGGYPRAAKPKSRPDVRPAIEVTGAREHNLRGIDARIPHGELVVVTGPSGSGKSSLAFDVVFAEVQRRFLETLTPYARQFLPIMPRPDVDTVKGLLPSIALEQRTTRAGGGSTVSTVTEIA
ncbi:MAG: excinuclease ABC subunit A, partial [Myxococcota bacterium]